MIFYILSLNKFIKEKTNEKWVHNITKVGIKCISCFIPFIIAIQNSL